MRPMLLTLALLPLTAKGDVTAPEVAAWVPACAKALRQALPHKRMADLYVKTSPTSVRLSGTDMCLINPCGPSVVVEAVAHPDERDWSCVHDDESARPHSVCNRRTRTRRAEVMVLKSATSDRDAAAFRRAIDAACFGEP